MRKKKKTYDTSWLVAATEKKYKTPIEIIRGQLDWHSFGTEEMEVSNTDLKKLFDKMCEQFGKDHTYTFIQRVFGVSTFGLLSIEQRRGLIRLMQPIFIKEFRRTDLFDLINMVIFGDNE